MSTADEAILAAVEQACREDKYTMDVVKKYGKPSSTDQHCIRQGASNPRVAYILAQPIGSTRQKLTRLQREGKVLRYPEDDARGSCIRWWPVGLLAKLRAEGLAP